MLKIAVLGASGVVGQSMLGLLIDRFPEAQVKAYGSEDTDKTVYAHGTVFDVDPITSIDFKYFDIVLSALPAAAALEWVPKALEAGCFVVDNSSAYRQKTDVPLVVPEINKMLINKNTNLVANPNCIAIPLSVALHALSKLANIVSVNVSTYQAASGAGKAAVEELVRSSAAVLNCQNNESSSCFAAPLAFNVVPQIDKLEQNGYSGEEMKIYAETRKILSKQDFSLNVTAVRVPVFNGHSQSVNCVFDKDLDINDICNCLANISSIQMTNDVLTPVTHAADSSAIWISRLRHDLSNTKIINFWLVSDNILKGAALNAVQIIEEKFL